MITSKPDRKHRVIERRIETLEDRICLTAAVDVIRGDLLVRGDSDGDVEINALGEGVYEVTDNGALVATAEGVRRDIRIRLDIKNPTENNNVAIHLNEESVRGIFARLGGGDDSFALDGGRVVRIGIITAAGHDTVNINSPVLDFRGVMGPGDDSVTVGENAMMKRRFFTALGSGDNTFTVDGAIRRGALIQGGHEVDSVIVSETGKLAPSVLRLGGGENNVEIHGTARDLRVFSGAPRPAPGQAPGSSAASVFIGQTGRVNGNLLVMTQGAHGDDTLRIEGIMNGNVGFGDQLPPPGNRGGGPLGSNEIVVAETATVRGNVFARFNRSLSTVDHFGSIGRDLRVHTDIRDNTFVTVHDGAEIGGRLIFHAKDDGNGPGGT